MRLPYQIALYPVRLYKDELEFLLLLRHEQRGGFWQGVTGGVETGENYVSAAIRELKEETGLNPLKVSEIDFSYSYPIEDKWKHLYSENDSTITEYVFVAGIDSNLRVILSNEHVEYQWCRIDDAVKFLDWEWSAAGIKKCEKYVQSNWMDSKSIQHFK